MIFNLTQHQPTHDQSAEGVGPRLEQALGLLNVDSPLSPDDLRARARGLAAMVVLSGAQPDDRVMIGGYPALMGPLELALREKGLVPVYAFSRRETVEETQSDGSIVKRAVFRHAGWQEGGVA